MKRVLGLLVLPFAIAAALPLASCSSKSGGDTTASGLTPEEAAKNPIQGIAAAKMLIDTGEYTDGPVWDATQKVLFFTVPLGEGDIPGLYRATPDGSAMKVRGGNATTGALPVGNAITKNGDLVTAEAKRLVRGNSGGDPAIVASGYPGDKGSMSFDTLNDAVVHANGTIYVTDPGYFADPPPLSNRLYLVAPDGTVSVAGTYDDVPRPNGVALSPDQSLLYVGFERPTLGTKPYIEKYHVQGDGSLAEHSHFVEFEMEASPDGIEVDKAGNVYVANTAGITVFKADAKKIGTIPIPDQPTGMAFGGDDLKTLYITTAKTKIYTVKVNVPGINQ